MKKFAMVWDDRYHCPEATSLLSTRKGIEVARRVRELGVATEVQPPELKTGIITWASVERVHDPAYARAVRTGEPRDLAESQGFRWSPRFADAVSRIWDGHLWSCALALCLERPAVVFHPVSGAHHARRSGGAGFCTLNFLVGGALAAASARGAPRASVSAVVDLDAHQGDGTYELCGPGAPAQPTPALFDISGSSFGVPEHATARSVYKVVRDASAYWAVLELLPGWLDRLKPGLVQYQAGMDCHQDDPIGGIPGVDAAFLARRDRLVIRACLDRKIPLVVNLAGGYQGDGVTVGLHVQTAEIIAESTTTACAC